MHLLSIITLAAIAMANPMELTERAPPAVGACTGPVVNLYGYPDVACTNPEKAKKLGSRLIYNSPIAFGLKFAPVPVLSPLLPEFKSPCQNTNQDPLKSLAFSADGSLTDNCRLHVYQDPNCQNPAVKGDFALTGAVVGTC